jgi:hypothetical protein
MAQKLFIKGPDGIQKAVKIIRSWATSGGNSIYLHENGRYAYKDGSPLKTAAELDILPRVQRDAALAWWRRKGQVESAAHYEAALAKAIAAAGDFRTEVPFPDELDAATYIRKKSGGKKNLAPSAPHTWREWFPKRPDWWGQAKEISFADYTYAMVEAAPADQEGEPDMGADLKSVPESAAAGG